MDVVIKKLEEAEIQYFKQLLTVFDIVFEYEPYARPNEAHLAKLLRENSCHVFVALLNDQVIAGLTAYVLEQYHSTKPILYIQDLAVLTAYQRQGVGKKLMFAAKAYCMNQNFQLLSVQAEKLDEEAVKFYHGLGPDEVLEAVYFAYSTEQ
ncbi:MAG TPA: GNAT family N-acetyltransferase [Saprospiraceae bacterium]|nr:GNAT family N-acetyltransferase [Saprospiraceae bacterium]